MAPFIAMPSMGADRMAASNLQVSRNLSSAASEITPPMEWPRSRRGPVRSRVWPSFSKASRSR